MARAHGIEKGSLKFTTFKRKQKLFIKIGVSTKVWFVRLLDFLTYSGLLSAFPDAWKRSILNSEETPNNSDEHNLTSVNVTAKIARKALVLETHKPPNVEMKLNEHNLPVKAINELPFKVTMKINLDVFNLR